MGGGKILAIAWKDLRSTMRNVPALTMMLLAPLALSGLLGFAFGGGGSFSIAATKVALADEDRGVPAAATASPLPSAGSLLTDVLTSEDLGDVLDVTQKDGASAARDAVDDGDEAVGVIVPTAFSDALYGAEGDRAAVELYENPTYEFGTALTAAIVDQTLLDFNGARAAGAAAAVTAEAGGDEQARAAAESYLRLGGVGAALSIGERAPDVASGSEDKEVGVVGLVLAGMMVFFMFFGASNVARTILTEDRAGTLPRLLTTPTPPRTVLAGKFSSVFLTVTVQSVVLVVAGRVLFAIDWGSIDAVSLLILAGAAVASGLALLVMSVVHTPAQAGSIGAGVYLVLALLGGNFTGTATESGTYATVQGFTPNGWLLRGWDTAMRGGGVADIVPELVIPLAFAVAFFAVAALRFGRRYA